MTVMMKAAEALSLAAEIEKRVGAIYYGFHERFISDPETARMWREMAVEEDGHASFLESQIRMIKTVPAAFNREDVDAGFLVESAAAIAEAEEYIKNTPGLSLKEAVDIAARIEGQMAEKRYGELVEVVSPALRKIFDEAVMKNNHVEKVGALAKRMGVK